MVLVWLWAMSRQWYWRLFEWLKWLVVSHVNNRLGFLTSFTVNQSAEQNFEKSYKILEKWMKFMVCFRIELKIQEFKEKFKIFNINSDIDLSVTWSMHASLVRILRKSTRSENWKFNHGFNKVLKHSKSSISVWIPHIHKPKIQNNFITLFSISACCWALIFATSNLMDYVWRKMFSLETKKNVIKDDLERASRV